jgi:SAM-dependent methyltransferase
MSAGHTKKRECWLAPAPEVQDIVLVLRERGVKHVLDLGCGVGRHVLFLASQGFQVWAIDGSANGIEFARKEAERQGLKIDFRQGDMTELPYKSDSVEYVLAWGGYLSWRFEYHTPLSYRSGPRIAPCRIVSGYNAVIPAIVQNA